MNSKIVQKCILYACFGLFCYFSGRLFPLGICGETKKKQTASATLVHGCRCRSYQLAATAVPVTHHYEKVKQNVKILLSFDIFENSLFTPRNFLLLYTSTLHPKRLISSYYSD
jgi:hypothetical protein